MGGFLKQLVCFFGGDMNPKRVHGSRTFLRLLVVQEIWPLNPKT